MVTGGIACLLRERRSERGDGGRPAGVKGGGGQARPAQARRRRWPLDRPRAGPLPNPVWAADFPVLVGLKACHAVAAGFSFMSQGLLHDDLSSLARSLAVVDMLVLPRVGGSWTNDIGHPAFGFRLILGSSRGLRSARLAPEGLAGRGRSLRASNHVSSPRSRPLLPRTSFDSRRVPTFLCVASTSFFRPGPQPHAARPGRRSKAVGSASRACLSPLIPC